jgi:hypothetical protein
VINAVVSRFFKLVSSQLSRKTSPNLNHLRPPSSVNAYKECLTIISDFKSHCAYSILRNHSLNRTLPAHLKKVDSVLLHHPCGSFEKCNPMQHNSRQTTWCTKQQSSIQHNYETSYLQSKSNYLGLALCYNKKYVSLSFNNIRRDQKHTNVTHTQLVQTLWLCLSTLQKRIWPPTPKPNFCNVNSSDDQTRVITTRNVQASVRVAWGGERRVNRFT